MNKKDEDYDEDTTSNYSTDYMDKPIFDSQSLNDWLDYYLYKWGQAIVANDEPYMEICGKKIRLIHELLKDMKEDNE